MLPYAKLELGVAAVLFAASAAIDVLAQQLGTYRSNAPRRFVAGLLPGIAIGMAGQLLSVTIGG